MADGFQSHRYRQKCVVIRANHVAKLGSWALGVATVVVGALHLRRPFMDDIAAQASGDFANVRRLSSVDSDIASDVEALYSWRDQEATEENLPGAAWMGHVRHLGGGASSSSSSAVGGNETYDDHCAEPHHPKDASLTATLCFLFFCFLACTIIDHLNLLVDVEWRFPVSVMMFLCGMFLGIIFLNTHVEKGIGLDALIDGVQSAANIDPHALLYIILPPLLYESASSMPWHIVRKVLPSAILLAVPGVCLNTFLTGFYIRFAISVDHDVINWSASWLLASILSATDPVAVVAALSALGAPAKLSALVEGESLLNDGSAVVVAYTLRDWVISHHNAPDEVRFCKADPDNKHGAPKASCVFGFFFQVAGGGVVLGFLAGVVVYWWIGCARNRNSTVLEMSIVLTAVYGIFFIAEGLKMSGVLAVVAFGFVVGGDIKYRFSHDARHAHHIVMSQIGYACNQVTFLAAGVISARFMWSPSGCDHTYQSIRAWLELIGLYIVCHITRAMVIACFYPLLQRMGYGITWKEAVILVYGGLRGAVGLVMGLIIEHDAYIDRKLKQAIAFHTSGIVLLTLFVNGQTVDGLYKRLQLYPMNPFTMQHQRKVLSKLEDECLKSDIKAICKDWFFQSCDFKLIFSCVPNFKHIKFDLAGLPCPEGIDDVNVTLSILAEHSHEFRRAQLEEAGTEYEKNFGQLWHDKKAKSKETFIQLVMGCNALEDRKDQMINVRNHGDRALVYDRGDHSGPHGMWVSSRSLKALFQDGDDHFEVKLVKGHNTEVSIGFFADVKVSRCVDKILAATQGQQVLGHETNSIGFNCTTCSVQLTGPAGSRAIEPESPRSGLQPGDTIVMRASRQPGKEWEITFELVSDGQTQRLLTTSFGPFPPEELYPAVEFIEDDLSITRTRTQGSIKTATSTTPSTTYVAADMMKGQAPTICGSLAGHFAKPQPNMGHEEAGSSGSSPAPAAQVEQEPQHVVEKPPPEKSVVEKPPPETMFVAPGFVEEHPSAQVGVDSPPGAAPEANQRRLSPSTLGAVVREHSDLSVGARTISKNSNRSGLDVGRHRSTAEHTVTSAKPAKATVELPCEPRLATDSETLNELFHVIFNTLNHHYAHMHEHGLLGDLAFSWLDETVGVAMDCANNETNAAHFSDFENRRSEGNVVLDAAMGFFGGLTKEKNHIVILFEPLIVEYLSLEAMVSHESIWDSFPHSWSWCRQYGYSYTRAKIEALWAFVEAHEHVLHNSAVLERFPDLVRCLEQVIDQAKTDLVFMEELRPRRFYYTRHLLAMRVLLRRRADKLEKIIEEGWIASSDGERLMESFRERIMHADLFFPRIDTRARSAYGVKSDTNWFRRQFRRMGSKGANLEDATAWQDVDLPEPVWGDKVDTPTSSSAAP